MSGATRPAAPSSAAHTSSPGIRPSVAYPHTMFATSCGFMSGATRPAAPSSAAQVSSPGIRPSVAYPHTMFATFCGSMSGATRTASLSSAVSTSSTPPSNPLSLPASCSFAIPCVILETFRAT